MQARGCLVLFIIIMLHEKLICGGGRQEIAGVDHVALGKGCDFDLRYVGRGHGVQEEPKGSTLNRGESQESSCAAKGKPCLGVRKQRIV